MSSQCAIKLTQVSKSFKIVSEDTSKKGTIFSKTPMITSTNNVLSDINLEIKKGEIVGVLGGNGSGKSTLLSIISKILEPDSGTIQINGKISAILELGMGFHPDLSGRENIYLKGELYGFSKSAIDEKINDIIRYSGIEKYIDNPIRTYSSGMTARLAFSIMINVDSEILVVDEVLSVGDSAFEIKAREHFKKLAMQGKTILFVSHQIDYLANLCTRAIWIDQGKIIRDGNAKEICSEYLNNMRESPDVIIDLANAGVPESQYKLALLYRDGKNFEQNLDLYHHWIELAALNGNSNAQVLWGDYLCESNNNSEAVSYYQSAANRGNSEAKLRLSSLNYSSDELDNLKNIFQQIALPGEGLLEYRYADLLLKISKTRAERKQSFELFCKSSKDGYLPAKYQIALMYRDGVGTVQNYDMMEKLLLENAELGHLPSIALLADLYSAGKILPKSDEKSFRYTLQAATLGNTSMMYKVSMMYREGVGVPRDLNLADQWSKTYLDSTLYWHYILAIDYIKSGAAKSKLSLSQIYNTLKKVGNFGAISSDYTLNVLQSKDNTSNLEKIVKIANTGNNDAIRRLASIYNEGIGTIVNNTAALKWYDKVAKYDDSWSKIRLAEMYRDGKGAQANPAMALHWYTESAKQDNTDAMLAIINMCASGTIQDEIALSSAITMLEKSSEGGNVNAFLKLGNIYYDGIGVNRDHSRALAMYEKAALLGNAWSKIRLAEMYRDGKGTIIDYNRSAMWFNDRK